MDFNDLNSLVEETFNISPKDLATEKEMDSLFDFDDKSVFITPENTPGLFYVLQKSTSTYLVRALTSADLLEDYKQIIESPENYPSLKLNLDEDIHAQLSYFACDSLELAKRIKRHACNKRFPLFEENLFNVSDHSDHWWLVETENKLEVSFKLRSENSGAIKIGALADSSDLCEKLQKLFGYFKLLFPVGEYSISESRFAISCEAADNPVFSNFKKIFLNGDTEASFWSYLMDLEMRSSEEQYLGDLQKANFLMLELAAMRRFFATVEAKL